MIRKFLIWSPRVLAILLIVFMSVFALDVFSEPDWPVALIVHLLPSFILIILTVIAWNREIIGGVLFLIISVIMGLFFHSIYLASPALVIAILFFVRDCLTSNKPNKTNHGR